MNFSRLLENINKILKNNIKHNNPEQKKSIEQNFVIYENIFSQFNIIKGILK